MGLAGDNLTHSQQAMLNLLVAAAPVIPWLMRVLEVANFQPCFVEPVWLSAWTGLSFGAVLVQTDFT